VYDFVFGTQLACGKSNKTLGWEMGRMRTTADVACLLLAFIAADVNAPIIYGAAGTRNVPGLSVGRRLPPG
jgi:hypothetical protein